MPRERVFNTEGLCVPSKHHMVDTSLERESRRGALVRFVEDYEREHGVITPEEVAAQDDRLDYARGGG